MSGMDVVRKIEANKTDARDKPVKDVQIVACGGDEVSEAFSVAKEDAKE